MLPARPCFLTATTTRSGRPPRTPDGPGTLSFRLTGRGNGLSTSAASGSGSPESPSPRQVQPGVATTSGAQPEVGTACRTDAAGGSDASGHGLRAGAACRSIERTQALRTRDDLTGFADVRRPAPGGGRSRPLARRYPPALLLGRLFQRLLRAIPRAEGDRRRGLPRLRRHRPTPPHRSRRPARTRTGAPAAATA